MDLLPVYEKSSEEFLNKSVIVPSHRSNLIPQMEIAGMS